MVLTVLLALLAVAVFFLLYEVIEREWLAGLDMETIHVLHRLRGLAGALIAATVTGWALLGWSQPLMHEVLSPTAQARGRRPSEKDRIAIFTKWFIQMRWIAVTVAAILIVIIVGVAKLLPLEVMWPLLATVLLLAGLNLGYSAILKQNAASVALLSSQAYVDLILLTVLLHFSGGLENPLAPLMLFHVIIAGVILSRRQCYAVALFGCALLVSLGIVDLAHLVPHYTLDVFPHVEHDGEIVHASHNPLFMISTVSLHSGLLLLTALFVTTLSARLRSDQIEIERYADEALTDRQLLERALESTDTGLCVYDRNLKPVWPNRQWLAWFAEMSSDGALYDRVAGEQSDVARTAEDRVTRVSEIALGNVAAADKPGQFGRTFQATTAALLDHTDEVSNVVQLVQEITEQKKTQAGMVRAGKLAAVGELAGEVAHEVNNPIAIINAKSRLLIANQAAELSEKARDEIAKIIDMSDRVARIMQGLLSYSRPSAAQKTQIDIREAVRRALDLVVQTADTANVEIGDSLGDVPIIVHANADEITQVFLNVFLNAIDAMPEGGQLSVSASWLRSDAERPEFCEIVVTDTGKGVAPQDVAMVFEPFFSTKPDGEGTGLGLSISQGLIQSHGGTIEFVSEEKRGSSVIIRLPLMDQRGQEGHGA